MKGTSLMAILFFAGAVSLLQPGCYYFAAQETINQAQQALDSASQSGAAESDPYNFTLAEQYLNKARSENRKSDFASAKVFAEKAIQRADAIAGVSSPQPVMTLEPAPEGQPEAEPPAGE